LAHSLGLTVVAEGVEDDETWEVLRGLGCDAVQGWLVSAALPASQATDWLRSHTRLAAPQQALGVPPVVAAPPAEGWGSAGEELREEPCATKSVEL
jgi:hypothetical protein